MNSTNGHQQNGRAENGNGKGKNPVGQKSVTTTVKDNENSQGSSAKILAPDSGFDQSVVLRQSPIWSRGVTWSIVGVTTAAILWAAIAKIEQVIPAQGQLKPQGTVKEIQAPINGVVKEVLVKDGEHVKQGNVLVKLDSIASTAELDSLKKVRYSLVQENQFYDTLMQQSLDESEVEATISRLNLPREVISLTRNRVALVAENRLYERQLGGGGQKARLTPEQLARLQGAQAELSSRAMAAKLEKEQLEQQLKQAQGQLADAKLQLSDDRRILGEIQARNQKVIAESQKSLAIEQGILGDVEPLLEEGALARLQVERQRQSISDRYQQLVEKQANGGIEDKKQLQQVQDRLTEIERLTKEVQRFRFAIDQAQERLMNTVQLSAKDTRDRMADNQKRIAEIDSQITKIIVENKKRIAELDSQISRAKVTLDYQDVRSPVSGTVFDLNASPGYVPSPTQVEPLLKIVPDDHLIAEVDITNKDIGFVRPGMKADVRIDSFPFSEFGDIKGEVISIGSDALPPDQIHQYYRFPTKVKLNQQYLKINGREIVLQSGMSVSANIKVRESRTVLSLFTELFTNKVESLKGVR